MAEVLISSIAVDSMVKWIITLDLRLNTKNYVITDVNFGS
jgi:hypothetical protein